MSTAPSPAYQFGDIILVRQMLDPNGVNPKDRPCVVVDDPKSPPASGQHLVVAISSKFRTPIPADRVLLPHDPAGHPVTGLKLPCVAVCPWIEVVDLSRIDRQIGIVPGLQLLQISTVLGRLLPPP